MIQLTASLAAVATVWSRSSAVGFSTEVLAGGFAATGLFGSHLGEGFVTGGRIGRGWVSHHQFRARVVR